MVEKRLLAADDGVVVELNYRADQSGFVNEVMVDLGVADTGRGAHVFNGGAGDAALGHELGRGLHHPLPGTFTLGGQPLDTTGLSTAHVPRHLLWGRSPARHVSILLPRPPHVLP